MLGTMSSFEFHGFEPRNNSRHVSFDRSGRVREEEEEAVEVEEMKRMSKEEELMSEPTRQMSLEEAYLLELERHGPVSFAPLAPEADDSDSCAESTSEHTRSEIEILKQEMAVIRARQLTKRGSVRGRPLSQLRADVEELKRLAQRAREAYAKALVRKQQLKSTDHETDRPDHSLCPTDGTVHPAGLARPQDEACPF